MSSLIVIMPLGSISGTCQGLPGDTVRDSPPRSLNATGIRWVRKWFGGKVNKEREREKGELDRYGEIDKVGERQGEKAE